jgi:hypothetical protein
MSFDVTKEGAWAEVAAMLAGVGEKFRQEVQQATDQSGALMEAEMVGRISRQELSPPLSPKYLARKIKRGLSEQILIATGTLMQNIRYHRKDWSGGFVGILRNVRHSSGQSLVNIAAVHEYGTRDGRIPARPFAGPTAEKTCTQVIATYEAAIERVFR